MLLLAITDLRDLLKAGGDARSRRRPVPRARIEIAMQFVADGAAVFAAESVTGPFS